ncbi:hypothetical protein BKA69DRAFT_450615 [Paraphysoderma sedebokerense]|nr:hypothetical protein BKA69DRAFT_450615 [Paraphysoderma sedebokerense]
MPASKGKGKSQVKYPPLTFPPFLPSFQSVIPLKQQELAYQFWINSLCVLLSLNDDEFIEVLSSADNDGFFQFLETYLRFRSKKPPPSLKPLEHGLDKKLFAVVYKLSRNSSQLAKSNLLFRINILVLFDLAKWYHHIPQTLTIFEYFVKNRPQYETEFRNAFEETTQLFRQIQKKYEKSHIGGKGKLNQPELSPVGEDDLRDTIKDLAVLLDICICYSSLIQVYPPSAQWICDYSDFMETLSNCYGTTVMFLRQILKSTPHASKVAHLQMALLQLAGKLLDVGYYSHLIRTKIDGKSGNEDAVEIVHRLTGVLMLMIENTTVEFEVKSFEDAPMIVDLEVEFDIRKRLKSIQADFLDEQDPHIEYIIQSLDQMMSLTRLTARSPTIPTNGSVKDKAPAVAPLDDDIKVVAMISQVQDLFPELGDGFVEACLSRYNNSTEEVINALLEGNLPPDLASLDRSMKRMQPAKNMEIVPYSGGAEIEEAGRNVLSERKNIFDGDEFDVFNRSIDVSKVHKGKKDKTTGVLEDKSFVQEHKEAILTDIFDEYEDEYDDTYDTAGIESTGAIDSSNLDEIDQTKQSKDTRSEFDRFFERSEPRLYEAYENQQWVFDRSATTRRSKERQELKRATGLADEQLEGWFLMVQRNVSSF